VDHANDQKLNDTSTQYGAVQGCGTIVETGDTKPFNLVDILLLDVPLEFERNRRITSIR